MRILLKEQAKLAKNISIMQVGSKINILTRIGFAAKV